MVIKKYKIIKTLNESFKSIKKKNYLILLYESLLYLVIIGLLIGFVSFFMKRYNELYQAAIIAYDPSPANIQMGYDLTISFVLNISGAILIFLFLMIFTWTLLRYLVWDNILEFKSEKKIFIKFFGLNTIWIIIALVPTVLLFIPIYKFVAANPGSELSPGIVALKYVLFLFFVVISSYTNVLHITFFNHKKIFVSLYRSVIVFFKKFHPLFTLYLLISVILWILNLPISLLSEGFSAVLTSGISIILVSFIKIVYRDII